MPTRTLAQLRADRDAAVTRVQASFTGEKSNIDRLGADVCAFAQKHPALAIGGAVGVGALAVFMLRSGYIGRASRIGKRLLISPVLAEAATRIFGAIGNGSNLAGG